MCFGFLSNKNVIIPLDFASDLHPPLNQFPALTAMHRTKKWEKTRKLLKAAQWHLKMAITLGKCLYHMFIQKFIPNLQMRNIYTVVMTLHQNENYQVLVLTNNLFFQQLGWCASFLTLRQSWKTELSAFIISNTKLKFLLLMALTLREPLWSILLQRPV